MKKSLSLMYVILFGIFLVLFSGIKTGYSTVTSKDIVIFGDSLSDVGYANNFHKIKKNWPDIPETPTIVKQATYTSPKVGETVWPQFLALKYRNENIGISNNINTPELNINQSVIPKLIGNNYAAGGSATVCKGIGEDGDYAPSPIGPLRKGEYCDESEVSIQEHNQIDSYLNQNNNQANSNTVYIIWGGANNAFLALNDFSNNTSTLSKLYLLTKYLIVNEVSPMQAISKMQSAADDIAYDVKHLVKHGANANNIYIINLPNLGITPEATDNGQNMNSFKVKLFESLSKAFNQQLQDDISKTNAHIIDAEKFFDRIVKDKAIKINSTKYSFLNVNQSACDFYGDNSLMCIPKNYISGIYDKYLFEGQVHPTSYSHQVFSIYIDDIINK